MSFDKDIVAAYFVLRRVARQYCPADEANDLAAEAITRALEHRQSYNPALPLLAWCKVILRNLYINTASKQSRKKTVRLGLHDAAAYTETDQQAIMADLNAVIESMTRKSLSVQTLMDFANGYSIAEIAAARHLPIGTAKRRIHDGRAMLAKALAI